MINFLIGHRGVGKTTLLGRLEIYAKEAGVPFQGYDLDREIERTTDRKIDQIFSATGESEFRKLEKDTLAKLLGSIDERSSVWIALGAGFDGPLPAEAEKIWVRRPTDSLGRVFLDRPRLNTQESAFDEYHMRFVPREAHFRALADMEVTLPEGFITASHWEAALFGFRPAKVTGAVTVLPERFRSLDSLRSLASRHRKLGVAQFEFRDDLFDFEKLQLAREVFEPREVIYSFRSSIRRPSEWLEAKCDWALELGLPPGFAPDILSLHERDKDIAKTFKRFPEKSGSILKAAVTVETFSELMAGHRWWLEDPSHRCFLPRSADGRWSWYRQLLGQKMPLAFWREGDGSAADQPLLADWMRTACDWQNFAAILGYPVAHSFTPAEHERFFAAQGMPVVGIPLFDEEWTEETLNSLTKLGLRAAAVTAPLKIKSTELVRRMSEPAQTFNSVNTLVYSALGWQGHNTDIDGLKELIPDEVRTIGHGDVAVWGGGGTRELIKRTLPNAAVFSARGGISDRGNLAIDFNPQVVVWAVGRVRMHALQWPPSQWKPKLIIDLNYSEDSPGREYALMTGAEYRGGLPMFKAQAIAQQEYWKNEHIRPTF